MFVLLIIVPIALTFLKLKEDLKEKNMCKPSFPQLEIVSLLLQLQVLLFITVRAECG